MWGIVLLLGTAAAAYECSFSCLAMCGKYALRENCAGTCGCGKAGSRAAVVTTQQCEEFCSAVAPGGTDLDCMQTCDRHEGRLILQSDLQWLSGDLSSDESDPNYSEEKSQQAPSGMSLKCYQSCIEICGLSDNSDCLDLCTLNFCRQEISAFTQYPAPDLALSDSRFWAWFGVSIFVLSFGVTILACSSKRFH